MTLIEKINNIKILLNYNNIKIIVISFFIFIIFLILRKVFTKYIFKILLRIFDKTKTEIDKKIFLSFEKPLNLFFVVLGIYFSLKYFRSQILRDKYYTSNFLENFFSTAIILLTAWGFYNISNTSSIIFSKLKEKYELNVDKILIPLISKLIRFFIIAFAVIMIIEKWGYDVQGFIAGLGLGGLAFALAAKDAAANIFGGIVILLDKPFTIGDWITSDDIDGIVEEISFRSTRIRTFEQGVIIVPNSILANRPITNWSRRRKRRVKLYIGVTYSTTSDKIKICVNKIKNMLENHPRVTKDNVIVSFETFSSSSLDIFIQFYVDTSKFSDYLNIKQDINLKIMNILEREQVSMAFPSTSIYFENDLCLNKVVDTKSN